MELPENSHFLIFESDQLIVEKDGAYAGVIHIHDLIKEGII